MRKVSVIIPSFQEGDAVRGAILSAQSAFVEPEIIVSDGSNDQATREVCDHLEVRHFVPSQHWRSAAMNQAAFESSGEILLFLHSDSRLPVAANLLEFDCLDGVVYGGFHKRFHPNSPALEVHSQVVNLWKLDCCQEFLGDNSMFVRRVAFDQVGGYRPMRIFEDLDLSNRLAAEFRGQVRIIRVPATTSSRRFEKLGVPKTLLLMQKCRRWYAQGVPEEEILRRYAASQ